MASDLFGLNEEETMVRETVQRFAEDEVLPGEIERDGASTFPAELVEGLTEQGMLGVPVPEEFDGAGLGMFATCLVVEELAKVSGSLALTVAAHSTLAAMAIVDAGTDEQKRSFAPGLSAGELGSFALTEDGAGSDAGAIATTARRDGDDWVLDGTKIWVTNAGVAEHHVVVARTSEIAGVGGLDAFLIGKDAGGLEIGDRRHGCGVRSAMVRDIHLKDCRVSADRRLGDGGGESGFEPLRRTLDRGRIAVGALALGLAEGAFARASKYATERLAFGKPIGKFQAVSFLLADMATKIEAARHLVRHAARLHDAGQPYAQEASMAKLFASEMAVKVASDAIQVHGGYGYTSEYHVERMYRDAKLFTIGEGTSELQRILISRRILDRAGERG